MSLVILSLLPIQTRSRSSSYISSCVEGAILCQTPGKTNKFTESMILGRGIPFTYIDLTHTTTTDGQTVVDNAIHFNIISIVLNILLISFASWLMLIFIKKFRRSKLFPLR